MTAPRHQFRSATAAGAGDAAGSISLRSGVCSMANSLRFACTRSTEYDCIALCRAYGRRETRPPSGGNMRDSTWNRLGRRRPYFLAGAVLATLALVAMPNSPALWIAAGLLWILDASINVSMAPFRALVGDMLPNRQRAFGFAMQSLFIGIGAVAASALPWMLANWATVGNVAGAGGIPDSVKWAFYIGAVAFIVAVSWTVITTREYPPEQFEEFHAQHATGSASPPAVSRSPWQYRAWGSAWIL